MPNIMPQCQMTYMPHKTFRLLNAMHDIALACLSYYIYFQAIRKVKFNDSNDWFVSTHNAYYDLCVLHWCMLFGESSSEKTHYFHLKDPQFNLAQHFEVLGIKHLEISTLNDLLIGDRTQRKLFNKFSGELLNYRNKNLIHREHDPAVIKEGTIKTPLTKKIFFTTYRLHILITKIASTFPTIQDSKNKFGMLCFKFKNQDEMVEGYLQTFPLRKLQIKK
jgi:hypothetical protein